MTVCDICGATNPDDQFDYLGGDVWPYGAHPATCLTCHNTGGPR